MNLKSFNKIVGSNMRKARHRKGLSMRKAGKIISISHQQMYKYETGRDSLSLYKTLQLCEIYGVYLHKILEGIQIQNHFGLKPSDVIQP